MKSSPQEDGWGQLYWALGTLNFHLSLGALSQMGGLKSFTLWGGRGFLYWGDGGRVPPPPGKVPPVDTPPNFYSTHQRFNHLSNK